MLDLHPEKRIAGALAPLFSVRGEHDLGLGDVAALRELITWSAELGLGFVQMLPINETGGDHSPYNILSSMAIEPSTLSCHPRDLPDLKPESYVEILKKHDSEKLLGERVNYPGVKALKRELLETAFANLPKRGRRRAAVDAFTDAQSSWLEPYGLYRALMDTHGTEVVSEWPEDCRTSATAGDWLAALPEADQAWIERRAETHRYIQWIAWEQWSAVHDFAEAQGVALIGDVPVGVSLFSADVWHEPHLFDLQRSSGAPPEKVFQADPFTEKWGQNWGFPLYNWPAMAKDNFRWWRRRLRLLKKFFHIVRVDHALGFFRIYSFPWRPEHNADFLPLSAEEAAARTGGFVPGFVEHDDSTPENCEKNLRLGEMLHRVFLEEIPSPFLIAEDLGEVPPYVRPCLAKLQVPGFKIPQWERAADGTFVPGNEYPRIAITTYATHDHPPVKVFWNEAFNLTQGPDEAAAKFARSELRAWLDFCGATELSEMQPYNEEIQTALLRGLLSTNAWLAAYSYTDLLGLDARFNVPGATGDQNWSYRLPEKISIWQNKWKPIIGLIRCILRDAGRTSK